MSDQSKPQQYRDIIDRLVAECQSGQCKIAADRVRQGLWNRNASDRELSDQQEINFLLQRMPSEDREILARMLSEQAQLGIFETLKALEEYAVAPFESGYEGTPYHDFIGRLGGWQWPGGNQ